MKEGYAAIKKRIFFVGIINSSAKFVESVICRVKRLNQNVILLFSGIVHIRRMMG